jgi:hypothetical protein
MNDVGSGYPVSRTLPLYVFERGTAGPTLPSGTATTGTERLELPCAATERLEKFGSEAWIVIRIRPSPRFTLPHLSGFSSPEGVFSSSLITGVGGGVLSTCTARGPLTFSVVPLRTRSRR